MIYMVTVMESKTLKRKKHGLSLKTSKKAVLESSDVNASESGLAHVDIPTLVDPTDSKERAADEQLKSLKDTLKIPCFGNWKDLEDLPIHNIEQLQSHTVSIPCEDYSTNSPPGIQESFADLPPPCLMCLTRKRPPLLTPDKWLFSMSTEFDVNQDNEKATLYTENDDDSELLDDKVWDDMMANLEDNHEQMGHTKGEEKTSTITRTTEDNRGKQFPSPCQESRGITPRVGWTSVSKNKDIQVAVTGGDFMQGSNSFGKQGKDLSVANTRTKSENISAPIKNSMSRGTADVQREDISYTRRTAGKKDVNINGTEAVKNDNVDQSRIKRLGSVADCDKPSGTDDVILLSSDSEDEPTSPTVVSDKKMRKTEGRSRLKPQANLLETHTSRSPSKTTQTYISQDRKHLQRNTDKNSTTKTLTKPTKNNRQEVVWEACPMCQYKFPKSFMKHEVERHINSCLEADDDEIAYL